MPKDYHNPAFEQTNDERRERLYEVATEAFATHGYQQSSVNAMAKAAGISIGALYKYFDSKEALFLSVVQRGLHLLQEILEQMEGLDLPFYERLEAQFRLTIDYAKRYPEMSRLYLAISTEELSVLSERLYEDLEISFKSYYLAILEKAEASGEIAKGQDLAALALQMDNLVVMLQFAYSVQYYRRRLLHYLELSEMDDDRVVEAMLHLIRKGTSR